jgi:hypothetical protein
LRLIHVFFYVLLVSPLWGQAGYSGPQVLSRGGGAGNIGERGGRPPGFSAFVGVMGLYETGLIPASLDSEGNIQELDGLIGVQANIGAYGYKSFRRTSVGLDYNGNYRHYNANTFINGSDHVLSLGLSNQLSRRLQVFSRTSAGTIARFMTGGAIFDSDAAAMANYAVFDNRSHYGQQSAGIQFTPTARLAMSASGDAWTVRRQSASLVGATGYGANGTLSYRLSRTRSIQGNYAFQHIDYMNRFGETDLHTTMAGLKQQLGRRWEVSLSGGVTKVNTIGVEQVAADPLTAALFGNTTSIQAFERSVNFLAGQVQLQGRFRTSSVSFSASQLPNAGNGVLLTSKQSLYRGAYSYTGLRKASLSLSVTRMSMDSVGQSQLGAFTFTSGGAGVSYKLLRSLDLVAQYDARDLQFNQAMGFARLSYRVGFGVNWNPGEFPITFW